MQTFTNESIDNMTVAQLRYMLKMQLERNELLVQQNEFTMYRYECLSGTMHILTPMPNGKLARISFSEYFDKVPDMLFNKEEHKRVVENIKRIIYDPQTPKTGAVAFTYKDGRKMSCEYSTVYDEKGEIIAIVGQHIDMYKTHQRLISTINTLNDKSNLSDGILNAYDTIISFNLVDRTYKVIRGTQAVRAISGQVSSISDLANIFRDFYIDKEYHKLFDDFVNLETIDKRIYGLRSLSCTYKTTNIGWCNARIVPIKTNSNGMVEQAVLTTESIEANTSNSLKTEAVNLDSLTGALNLSSAKNVINEALQKKHKGIFMVFDCDFFSAINNMLGNPVGDMLLIEVAKVLTEMFTHDIIARVGSDEFVVFSTNPETISLVENTSLKVIYDNLSNRLNQIYIPELNGINISVSGSLIYHNTGKDYNFEEIYATALEKLEELKKENATSSIVTMEM